MIFLRLIRFWVGDPLVRPSIQTAAGWLFALVGFVHVFAFAATNSADRKSVV